MFNISETGNSNELFSLTSKNIHTQLFQNILALDDFLDVSLSVGSQQINAHRFVLAGGSEYFYNILKHETSKYPIIVFTDVNFEHLKKIVQYLYTGKTDIHSNELKAFFDLAQRFKILGLYNQLGPDDLSLIGSVFSSEPSPFTNSTETDKNTYVSNEQKAKRKIISSPRQNQRIDHHRSESPEQKTNTLLNDRKRVYLKQNLSGIKQKATKNALPTTTSNEFSSQTISTPTKHVQISSRYLTRSEKKKQTRETESDKSFGGRSSGFYSQAENVMKTLDKVSTEEEYSDDSSYLPVRSTRISSNVKSSRKATQRHRQKSKNGKIKQFKCRTCSKSFYLRLALLNHFKSTTCNPTEGFDQDD